MGRKILLITTDQQRYDALGCNGGQVARTPVADGLADTGICFRRAYAQNVLCSPARSSILTGQLPRTHGVRENGIALPPAVTGIAGLLHDHGYRTALVGKAHFEPNVDPNFQWVENTLARDGSTGPYRGFDRVELALHGYWQRFHYDKWLEHEHPESIESLLPFGGFGRAGLGDTGATQTKYNPMPVEHYHTHWVAQRTIDFLDTLDAGDDWFVWMSFPDPHNPWDPPAEAARRIDWRELDLPAAHPGSPDDVVEVLARKPHHWLDWYEGRFPNMGGPMDFAPALLTHDQVREVNALIHAENELIDQACGQVLDRIAERGWAEDTDVFFTTDHGELQGDFGFLFKGPWHVEALMRIPLIWRPAPSAGVTPAEVEEPVGQVDLAPTMCAVAGLPVPEWMQGAPLPVTAGSRRERVVTEWDSGRPGADVHLRTIYRDGWVCTVYEPSALYEGTEGELYDLADDPQQFVNLWDDPARRPLRDDLVADLYDHLPPPRDPALPVESLF